MILTYLLLLTALIVHMLFDLHKQKVHKPIIHWLSAMIVVLVATGSGWINQLIMHVSWWQFMIYSLSIHAALFDVIWNLDHHENIFYAGDINNPNRAWTDRIWSRVSPGGQILFRAWILIFGGAWYYELDRILG